MKNADLSRFKSENEQEVIKIDVLARFGSENEQEVIKIVVLACFESENEQEVIKSAKPARLPKQITTGLRKK